MKNPTECGCPVEGPLFEFSSDVDPDVMLDGTELPCPVELLEPEPGRIGALVATRTFLIVKMGGETLARCLEGRIVHILNHREVDVRRRRRNLLAKEYLADRKTAQRRRRPARVRVLCQHTGLCQDTRARIAVRKAMHVPVRASHRDVVQWPQRAVHRKIPGREEIAKVALLVDQQVHDGSERLLSGCASDRLGEGGIDERVLGKIVDPVEAQIIGEECALSIDETPRGKQPVDFALEPGLIVEAPLGCGIQKLGIRCGIPKKK